MSSNALSVSALERVSFQLFAESVKTHSSSTQFCRQSVPRCRAAHSERQEQFLSADCHSRVPAVPQTEERRLPANDDTGTPSLLRYAYSRGFRGEEASNDSRVDDDGNFQHSRRLLLRKFKLRPHWRPIVATNKRQCRRSPVWTSHMAHGAKKRPVPQHKPH